MNAIKKLIVAIDAISEWIGRIVSVLIPLMVLVLLAEVIMRYAFDRPTLWAYDTAIFMYGYVGILAGAYTLKHKNHIVVDVVYNLFSPRTKAAMNVFTGLLMFLFLIVFIKYTLPVAITALKAGHRTNTQWAPPLGHFRLIIPIGAALLILQGIANWIRDVYFAFTGRQLPSSKDLDPAKEEGLA
jgi:TRAP-type mannitol/chloroaromatic compound transport system permease small subunit